MYSCGWGYTGSAVNENGSRVFSADAYDNTWPGVDFAAAGMPARALKFK